MLNKIKAKIKNKLRNAVGYHEVMSSLCQQNEILSSIHEMIASLSRQNEVLGSIIENQKQILSIAAPPLPLPSQNIIKQAENVVIENFEQLDNFIEEYKLKGHKEDKEFFRLYSVAIDKFYTLFGGSPPYADPYSKEYWQWEMAFFEFLAGKKYNFNNEGYTGAMLPCHPSAFFPVTRMIAILQGQKELLVELGDIKGKCILEMGCGFGKFAAFFESCGCDYYAVDACDYFVEVTKKQIFSDKIKSQIKNKSFYDFCEFNATFDFVLFEASFHHCGEQARLLNLLYEHTSSNAQLIFLNEPIQPWFDRAWGVVRYDGETMLQIRMRGWLELGYRDDFFFDLLDRTGWEVKEASFLYEGTRVFIAQKNSLKRLYWQKA